MHLLLLAAPDVVVKSINENWEFILLACDGIWDVLSNEEVLKFVRTRIAQQMPPELVEKLFSGFEISNNFFYLLDLWGINDTLFGTELSNGWSWLW